MMKHRTFVCILICMLCCSILICCNGRETADDEYGSDVTNHSQDTDSELSDQPIDKNGNIELSLYTIDYDTYECVPTVSVFENERAINAENIVKAVTANFIETVKVTDIIQSGKSITVCFSPNYAPVKNVSAEMETSILDCISYSLLDNLISIEEIYFKTSAEGYKSEFSSFANDEPYVTK